MIFFYHDDVTSWIKCIVHTRASRYSRIRHSCQNMSTMVTFPLPYEARQNTTLLLFLMFVKRKYDDNTSYILISLLTPYMRKNYVLINTRHFVSGSIFCTGSKLYIGTYGSDVVNIMNVKRARVHTHVEFKLRNETYHKKISHMENNTEIIKFGKSYISSGNRVKKTLFDKDMYRKRKREEEEYRWHMLTI